MNAYGPIGQFVTAVVAVATWQLYVAFGLLDVFYLAIHVFLPKGEREEFLAVGTLMSMLVGIYIWTLFQAA